MSALDNFIARSALAERATLPGVLCREIVGEINRLKTEIRLLREYGNKDCLAQADEAIAADEKAESWPPALRSRTERRAPT